MHIVFGQRLCGKVDRVPGLLYVGTMFFHIDYLPILPLKSYVILEGTEQGENFRGTRIPLRLRSVLAAYLRVALGAVIFGAAGLAAILLEVVFPFAQGWRGLTIPAIFLTLGGFAYVVFGQGRWVYAILGAIIAASVGVCLWSATAPKPNPALVRMNNDPSGPLILLLVADGAAFLYTMLRTLSLAGHDRAQELAVALGLDPEVVDPFFAGAETHAEVHEGAWAGQAPAIADGTGAG